MDRNKAKDNPARRLCLYVSSWEKSLSTGFFDFRFMTSIFRPDTGVEVEIFDDAERELEVGYKFACQFDIEDGTEDFRLEPVFVAGDADVHLAAAKREVHG